MLDPNSKIHIVGGTGAMGTWLKKLLDSLGFEVTVSDETTGPSGLKNADIVFISVPIEIAPEVILKSAKLTGTECLIVDLSSIKSKTQAALKKSGRSNLSMHFLFGPSVSSIQSQKIIIQKPASNEIALDLIQLLKKEGAQFIEMDSKKHDFVMAHIQSLTHFINLTLAEILIKNKIGVKTDVSTPVFLSQLASTLRVLSQNPKLLTEIQTLNPVFLKVVEEFMLIQKKLIEKIKGKKLEEIEEKFKTLRKNLESISGKSEPRNIYKTEELLAKGLKIGYLGPEGTFSNQATLLRFNDKENSLIPGKNIYELFETLDKNKVDLIVSPAENTIEGTVRETLDLLFDYEFKVIGKIDLEVRQNLLSKEKNLAKITRVISHPQALNQSRDFLEENLPEANLETSPSTIASIEELKNPGVAIIGSQLAAKIYNLNTLRANIQNQKNNVTRFYIVAKKDLLNIPGRTKTLLFLSIFNRVGILRDIFSIFADLSINLNKIESRPSKEKNWDYYFYIEIELTDENPRFSQALNLLKQFCPNILILGKL